MGSSLTSSSLIETLKFAKEVANGLVLGDVVCLRGDLGVGKTTFAKGLISTLAKQFTEDEITSPTFVTMNLYDHIAHFDLYRLESMEAFVQSGFEEYLEEPYIAIIEWPELIEPLLPKHAKNIHIECQSDGVRKFV